MCEKSHHGAELTCPDRRSIQLTLTDARGSWNLHCIPLFPPGTTPPDRTEHVFPATWPASDIAHEIRERVLPTYENLLKIARTRFNDETWPARKPLEDDAKALRDRLGPGTATIYNDPRAITVRPGFHTTSPVGLRGEFMVTATDVHIDLTVDRSLAQHLAESIGQYVRAARDDNRTH